MTPREFFPNMPDEVFEDWLGPLIEVKGWPFTSIDDDLQVTDLRYILGLDNTLREWCTCEWELTEIDPLKTKFTIGSIQMIQAIISHAALGQQSATSNVENSTERFSACSAYINEHGNIPKPIVIKPENEGYALMDGNHRLAAFLYLELTTKVPAWIAKIT